MVPAFSDAMPNPFSESCMYPSAYIELKISDEPFTIWRYIEPISSSFLCTKTFAPLFKLPRKNVSVLPSSSPSENVATK